MGFVFWLLYALGLGLGFFGVVRAWFRVDVFGVSSGLVFGFVSLGFAWALFRA